MKALSKEQYNHYREHGFLHITSALPADLLDQAQALLHGWVDRTIESWMEQGLIDDAGPDLDQSERLCTVWHRAGKPKYQRSPRAEIVGCDVWQILRHPALVNVAEDLLGTPEITTHSVFNARIKCPEQTWTNTPWHQDAQYRGISAHHHVPTFWFPLQDVTRENSCLGVHADFGDGRLFEPYSDETGFLGISPEDRKQLESTAIEMAAGDLLCFTSLTPHHAYPNTSNTVRFSMDVRYEAIADVDKDGEGLGFVVRSEAEPGSVESCEQWLAKGWEGRTY